MALAGVAAVLRRHDMQVLRALAEMAMLRVRQNAQMNAENPLSKSIIKRDP